MQEQHGRSRDEGEGDGDERVEGGGVAGEGEQLEERPGAEEQPVHGELRDPQAVERGLERSTEVRREDERQDALEGDGELEDHVRLHAGGRAGRGPRWVLPQAVRDGPVDKRAGQGVVDRPQDAERRRAPRIGQGVRVGRRGHGLRAGALGDEPGHHLLAVPERVLDGLRGGRCSPAGEVQVEREEDI